MVLVDESAAPVSMLDWAGSGSRWGSGGWRARPRWGPLSVVVLEAVDEDAAEVALVVDEDPVEAVAADRADDALGVGVRNRREDHPDFAREDLVEDAG
jgi:hypothetical protein